MPNTGFVTDSTTYLDLCLDDDIKVLSSENDGGIWTGLGITDSVLGTFDPLLAGVGVHMVVYTIYTPCLTFNDSLIIEIEDCQTDSGNGNILNPTVFLELPNVITPNGDFINDTFQPVQISGIDKMETFIVNRWGNTVFKSEDTSILWDGVNAVDGVYFWTVKFTDIFGESGSKHGFVTVIN